MLRKFLELISNHPLPDDFPQRRKAILTTLIFAVFFGKRTSTLPIKYSNFQYGGLWDILQFWIRFQATFHPKKYFLLSPLVKVVAGGYSSDQSRFSSDFTLNEMDEHATNVVANRICEFFVGLRKDDVRLWLQNQMCLIRKVESITKTTILSSNKSLVEVGGGVGGMLALAAQTGTQKIVSVDISEMQVLQTTFLEVSCFDKEQVLMINSKAPNLPRRFLAEIEGVKLPPFSLIAMYSFTELPIGQREEFKDIFGQSNVSMIVCNQYFGGVNNFVYIEDLAKQLGKEFSWISVKDVFGPHIPSYIQKHRIYVLSSSV